MDPLFRAACRARTRPPGTARALPPGTPRPGARGDQGPAISSRRSSSLEILVREEPASRKLDSVAGLALIRDSGLAGGEDVEVVPKAGHGEDALDGPRGGGEPQRGPLLLQRVLAPHE